MPAWDIIAGKVEKLPPHKQEEVLDFVEFLCDRSRNGMPLPSPAGMWNGFDIAEVDIEEARRESWASFPREDL